MARIRTIKPEFWTDTLMVQMDPLTRLLYIGLWTAADDFGALPDEPERLAMQVMPREPVDSVEQRIDMLVASGRLSRMLTNSGETYLLIEKWFDHQRVDKPTKSRIIREGSRKLAIPAESRRRVAAKYKCEPGETSDASCYFCGQPGQVHWPRLHSGRPGSWVCFSGLEIDHFEPDSTGGSSDETNLILSCRGCNRARRDRSSFDFVIARLKPRPDLLSQAQDAFERNIRELSRGLPDGREGKGIEGRGGDGIDDGKIIHLNSSAPPPAPRPVRKAAYPFPAADPITYGRFGDACKEVAPGVCPEVIAKAFRRWATSERIPFDREDIERVFRTFAKGHRVKGRRA